MLDFISQAAGIGFSASVICIPIGLLVGVLIGILSLVDWKEWSVIRKRKQADRRLQRSQARMIKRIQNTGKELI